MWEFVTDRSEQIAAAAFGHVVLVLMAVLIGTVLGIVGAFLVTQYPKLEGPANAISSIGLTLPSFALVGIAIVVIGLGFWPALVAVAFYAVFPVLRNGVVGLRGVNPALVESARGMGMSGIATMTRVQLPLAWPVILAGVRVSTQMSMGVAAIAAYLLGPGFGNLIFTGLSQGEASKNGLNYVLTGTIAVVILALIIDGLLVLLGKLTISKGIRV